MLNQRENDGRDELVPPMDDRVYRASIAAKDRDTLQRVILEAWQLAGTVPELGIGALVVQAHYKPRSRARLLVRVEIPRPPPKKRPLVQYLYLQAYPTLAAARRRVAQLGKVPLKCVGPAVFLLEEWACVVWALPNGPMLRTTKMMLGRKAFARFLAEADLAPAKGGRDPRPPKLIRYVPRSRALFRYRGPREGERQRLYIKVYAPGQDLTAAANLAMAGQAASSAAGTFAVPSLVAHVRRRRALVMREIPGRRLSEVDPVSESPAFEAAGRALAGLHASTIVPARQWSARREVVALQAAMADIELALPALTPRLRELLAAIRGHHETLVFPPDRPIHANMFGDQVLVGEANVIGIVDWDDLSLGDPLFDLGRLIAHGMFLAQRAREGAAVRVAVVGALLRGYADGRGSIDLERLHWHVATALLLRAKISALRPLPESWLTDVNWCVGVAGSILQGQRLEGQD